MLKITVRCVRDPPTHQHLSLIQYLRELINLFQSFLYLEASSITRHPIHHSHHRLFDHLPADEALQRLSDLQAIFCIPCTELLHLKHVKMHEG